MEDVVVFPHMTLTLPLDAGDEERVLLVPVHDGSYAKVGTVAEIAERVRLPGGAEAVTLTGLHRGVAGAASADGRGRLRVDVDERPDEPVPPARTRELERESGDQLQGAHDASRSAACGEARRHFNRCSYYRQ